MADLKSKLDLLEVAAKAASKGRWRPEHGTISTRDLEVHNPQKFEGYVVADMNGYRLDRVLCGHTKPPETTANMGYIAAVSPDLMLALTAEIREAIGL